jgi:glycosyltransferase involved in cell wall biosynthesis
LLDVTYLLVDASMTLDNSPGLQSQVLDRIKHENVAGIRTGLVTTVVDAQRFQEVAGDVLRDGAVPFRTVDQHSLPVTIALAAWALRRFQRRHATRWIYVRGIWGALAHRLAFPFGGPPLMYDYRGDLVAEARARGTSGWRLSLLERLTQAALHRAESLMTVSQGAAEVIAEHYHRPGAAIIPSAVDPARFHAAQSERRRLRESLGFAEKDVVLVYSGSVSSYQLIPEMLGLWAALQDVQGIRFLLLTSSHPGDASLGSVGVAESSVPLVHKSLEREQVPAYLAAADVGFLLRRNDDINRVAFPIKFAEYLAAGLAVVTSPALRDVRRIVMDHDIGLLVDPDRRDEDLLSVRSFLDRVGSSRAEFRRRAKKAVLLERLDWASHMEEWREVLAKTPTPRSDSAEVGHEPKGRDSQ